MHRSVYACSRHRYHMFSVAWMTSNMVFLSIWMNFVTVWWWRIWYLLSVLSVCCQCALTETWYRYLDRYLSETTIKFENMCHTSTRFLFAHHLAWVLPGSGPICASSCYAFYQHAVPICMSSVLNVVFVAHTWRMWNHHYLQSHWLTFRCATSTSVFSRRTSPMHLIWCVWRIGYMTSLYRQGTL